jgi:hypothetical protein
MSETISDFPTGEKTGEKRAYSSAVRAGDS